MVGVAVVQVDAAGVFAGCFQVGHDVFLVQGRVVGVQQRGADAAALAAGADGEDGEVVVFGAGQVVGVQFGVEDSEPVRPRPGDAGQVLVIPVGRGGRLGAVGIHSAAASRAGVVSTRPSAIACSTWSRK